MTLNAPIPHVFYQDIRVGIAFFCDAVCVHPVTSAEVAKQDCPEIRFDAGVCVIVRQASS